MVWHIKKTSMMGAGVGTVYYKGDKRWTETYADRATYTSQAKSKKQKITSGRRKTTAGWDVTAVNENA